VKAMAGDEQGITNLGPVPEGMSFLEATRALPLKVAINPEHQSRRLTICETMREVWRMADRIGGQDGQDLKALAAAGFHYGKAMDARMKELKAMMGGGHERSH